MRKGISLPVEMIVIIALAVIVLLAAGAFFAVGFMPGAGQTEDVAAWQRACGTMKLRGCTLTDFTTNANSITVPGYDSNKDGSDDFVLVACQRATGYTSATDCHKDCCLVSDGIAGGGSTPGGSSSDDVTRNPRPDRR